MPNKKYMLVIPDLVKKEDARYVTVFKQLDGMVIKLPSTNMALGKIPKDWLQEILECCKCGKELDGKDASWDWIDGGKMICAECKRKKQMTFKEFMRARELSTIAELKHWKFSYDDMKACHEWTIENERLKHEPRQSFEEWKKENLPRIGGNQDSFAEFVWQACEKNRGYNEN